MPLRLVPRAAWGPRPADWVIDLVTPVPNVVLKYFTFTKPCLGDEQCFPLLRKLQEHHLDIMGFADIEYNFLIGSDGTVYEGRGWNIVSTNYHEYEGKSIDIAYLGDYRRADPSPEMVQGFKDLVAFGIENNYILPNYEHREIRAWDFSVDYGWRSPLEEEEEESTKQIE